MKKVLLVNVAAPGDPRDILYCVEIYSDATRVRHKSVEYTLAETRYGVGVYYSTPNDDVEGEAVTGNEVWSQAHSKWESASLVKVNPLRAYDEVGILKRIQNPKF